MDKVFYIHLALIFVFMLIFVVMYELFSAPAEFMFVDAYVLVMVLLMTDSILRKEEPNW